MIIGLGSDLVNAERIRRSLAGLGQRWVTKILVPVELERAPSWNDALYVAKLFAAKEACSKALGTGMTDGVHWHNIEIVLPNTVALSGAALHRLNAITESGHRGRVILDVFCRDNVCGAIAVAFQIPQNDRELTFPTRLSS
ncbi:MULTISPECIES: holo-ACP synthase [Sinorhizobium]|uniref:holo-ACP synthase n=1 Tax=Sinorhizobium TaxID=28105 RepID=UPI000BE8E33F|nr:MULTISPECIES: holo-ACP synthase [Sinorhizobium]PDT50587.1 holo-ACP synthase [Sinorhizobium sp. NG07B]